MVPAPDNEIVARGTLPSYEFVTVRHGAEVVHWITATGPIALRQRLPLYAATLAANPSSNYFCILDNRGGHENDLSFSDIAILNQILADGGIDCIYGATVTHDRGYPQFVDLMSENLKARDIRGELLSTGDMQAAEDFIADKLRLVAGGG